MIYLLTYYGKIKMLHIIITQYYRIDVPKKFNATFKDEMFLWKSVREVNTYDYNQKLNKV